MSVTEVLAEVERLSETEKRIVLEQLQKQLPKQLPPLTDAEKRAEMIRRLQSKGLLSQLPTHEPLPPELRDFKPVEILGKPLSETIIEERG